MVNVVEATPNRLKTRRRMPVREPASVAEALLRRAEANPDAPAFAFGDIEWTYGDLLDRGREVGAALLAHGYLPGEHIILLLENSPYYVELMIGAVLVGVVPVPCNVKSLPPRMGPRMSILRPRAIFVSGNSSDPLIDVAEQSLACANIPEDHPPVDIWVADGDARGHRDYEEFIAEKENGPATAIELPKVDLDSPFIVMFSAGLSGIPKTCRLSNRNLLSKVPTWRARFEADATTRLWVPLPMFQVGFMLPFFATLVSGGMIVSMESFEARQALDVLVKHEITHVQPLFLDYWWPIVRHMDFRPSLLPALRVAALIGPADSLLRLQRMVPQCAVVTTYGSAPVGGVVCMTEPMDPAPVRLGSVGKPFPGFAVRIIDEKTGYQVEQGVIGHVQISTELLIPGFPDDDNVPARADDGWLRTSDLGALDADGNLYLHGRIEELLEIGGHRTFAHRIEAALIMHPAVETVQVLGVPDEEFGQVPAAFIEFRPGESARPDMLINFCRVMLDDLELPRYIVFVKEWPRSASKIVKHLLLKSPLGRRLDID